MKTLPQFDHGDDLAGLKTVFGISMVCFYSSLQSNETEVVNLSAIQNLGKVGVDEALLEADEHGQRSDQLEFDVAERVADGGKRPSRVRFAFLCSGRVHEQPDARHERRGDGHADETTSGEHAGQQLRGLACEHGICRLWTCCMAP